MYETPMYADIILPLLPDRLFSYRVPGEMQNLAQTGMRAIVQFGTRRYYTGIIKHIHKDTIEGQEYKSIHSLPDNRPLVNQSQLKFWDWISDYYMCSPGEVYKAAVPAGLKLESESLVYYNIEFDNTSTGQPRLDNLLNIIRDKKLISLADLSRVTGKKEIIADIRSLQELGAVSMEENLKEKFKPSREKYVRLHPDYQKPDFLQKTLEELSRAPRQKEILTRFLEKADGDLFHYTIPLKMLAGASGAPLINILVKKGVFIVEEQEVAFKRIPDQANSSLAILNDEQAGAFREIKNIFLEKDVCLLHGVTSSGKTEIYIHLIAETLMAGKQVLYLLPEIALTSQIIERLRKVFGNKTGIYHSRFSDKERVDVYNKVLSATKEGYQIVLGARSAIYLPFSKLGLVIVDEEHENTFKQFDPAPRYHARDSAIVLAKIHDAKVLLGTATPSVETWANCKHGKYGLAVLKNRYGEIKMPEIIVANLRESRRKKNMNSVFTPLLIKEMETTLAKGKQIILFQNRRGYSAYIECEECGHIHRCRSCDVSLTYHKFTGNLICHYCSFTRNMPGCCDNCKSTRLVSKGFGTELVKDDIELIFPGVKVSRLDLDTSRSVKSYEKILHDFAAGKTKILAGTQMLSKGLDFDHVGLVGILNADQMLNYPDFRAYERSFQLMMQVSGRAGRRDERGKVIIQTSDPGNPVIRYVRDNNFEGFFSEQFSERLEFHYPPFVRMIRITLKHKKPGELKEKAIELTEKLKDIFGKRVLGPQEPVVSRIQSYYIRNILIKIERKSSFERARKLTRRVISEFHQTEGHSLKIIVDVDPA